MRPNNTFSLRLLLKREDVGMYIVQHMNWDICKTLYLLEKKLFLQCSQNAMCIVILATLNLSSHRFRGRPRSLYVYKIVLSSEIF
jgi:hypothetical protein